MDRPAGRGAVDPRPPAQLPGGGGDEAQLLLVPLVPVGQAALVRQRGAGKQGT